MNKVVLASSNPGKLREIEAVFEPLAIEVLPQSRLGIPDAEEPYESFLQNALAKARHASGAAGLPSLADDSGLCVPALGGAPGVHSAYYAGRGGDRAQRDSRNNAKLLAELKGPRAAYYVCVIAVVRTARDSSPVVAEARWHGEIAVAPRGQGGFGYDPLFLLPELGKTAAELAPEEKNRISHRAQALRAMIAMLKNADLA